MGSITFVKENGITYMLIDGHVVSHSIAKDATDVSEIEAELAGKMNVYPTNETELDTFGDNIDNHQLPTENLSSLSDSQVEKIKNNIIFWIKKGYIKASDTLYILQMCGISDTYYYIQFEMNDDKILAVLDITSKEYTYTFDF